MRYPARLSMWLNSTVLISINVHMPRSHTKAVRYISRPKNIIDQKKFIDDLRALNGNLNVTLVLYKYDDKIYEK